MIIPGARVAHADYQVGVLTQEDFIHHGVAVPAGFARMREKRASEHLAGRICAKQALEPWHAPKLLALSTCREKGPEWPPGMLGSISHSAGVALACVAPQHTYSHIGIDVESVMSHALCDRVHTSILTREEIDLFQQMEGLMSFACYTSLLFSAKEAIFKGIHKDVGRAFGFHAARLTYMDGERLEFRLTEALSREWGPERRLALNYLHWRDKVYTWLLIG